MSTKYSIYYLTVLWVFFACIPGYVLTHQWAFHEALVEWKNINFMFVYLSFPPFAPVSLHARVLLFVCFFAFVCLCVCLFLWPPATCLVFWDVSSFLACVFSVFRAQFVSHCIPVGYPIQEPLGPGQCYRSCLRVALISLGKVLCLEYRRHKGWQPDY